MLAEEVISEYVKRGLRHAEHLKLDKNYWTFINKLELAAALSDDERHDKWVWPAIRELNQIRYRYGHSLEPKGTAKLEKSIIESVTKHSPKGSVTQPLSFQVQYYCC